MSWDALLKADAVNLFASADAMPGVEPVTLLWRSGNEEIIDAPVWRELAENPSGGIEPVLRLKVFVPRTDDRASLDKSALSISVPTNVGDDATSHPVVSIERQDAGGWLLVLR